jgi:hypothetical protein
MDGCLQLDIPCLYPEEYGVISLVNTFHVPPTELKPWQVIAVAWMGEQEKSPLKGGLLADACGMGKTLTTLTHLGISNPRADPDNLDALDGSPLPAGTYSSTLILVPNAVVLLQLREPPQEDVRAPKYTAHAVKRPTLASATSQPLIPSTASQDGVAISQLENVLARFAALHEQFQDPDDVTCLSLPPRRSRIQCTHGLLRTLATRWKSLQRRALIVLG